MLVLRDGRKIIGIMRSFDQFSNIVLEHAEERVVVGKRFADVPLGLYVIRGENLVLLGQIVRACDASVRVPGPTALTPPRARAAQDDAKEEVTVSTLLERCGGAARNPSPPPLPCTPTQKMRRDCQLTRAPPAHQGNGRGDLAA